MMTHPKALQPEVDRLIAQWQDASHRLAEAKADESRLRSLLVDGLFNPSVTEGTETIVVSHGFKLKAIKAKRYCFATANAAREAMLTLAGQGPEGIFIANRLIAWEPKLIVREYRSLTPVMLSAIAHTITTRDATPQLLLVPPK